MVRSLEQDSNSLSLRGSVRSLKALNDCPQLAKMHSV